MMSLHIIQLHILSKVLASEKGIKFSEGKPPDIENDLYNYHLKQLLREGLIQKSSTLYTLSDEGKRLVGENMPLDPVGNRTELFRVNTLMIALRKNKGQLEVLDQQRKRHPYFGDRGVPGGGIKKGELATDAANRKLKMETGLEGEFKVLGILRRLRYTPDQKLVSDVIYHVCITEGPRGELQEDNFYGINRWVSIDEAIRLQEGFSQSSPKLQEIIRLLKTTAPKDIPFFFYEEKKVIEYY